MNDFWQEIECSSAETEKTLYLVACFIGYWKIYYQSLLWFSPLSRLDPQGPSTPSPPPKAVLQPPPRAPRNIHYSAPQCAATSMPNHSASAMSSPSEAGEGCSLRSVCAGFFPLWSILAVRYFKVLYFYPSGRSHGDFCDWCCDILGVY